MKNLTKYHDAHGDLLFEPKKLTERVWLATEAKWKYILNNPDRDDTLGCSLCSLYIMDQCRKCPLLVGRDRLNCTEEHHPFYTWHYGIKDNSKAQIVLGLIQNRHEAWKKKNKSS